MSSSSWTYVEVDLLKKKTAKAFLIVVDGEEIWIPKACVADPDDYEEGDRHLLMAVTESIAREKGIE